MTQEEPNLKKYAEELKELEKLPPALIAICPIMVLAIISNIQLSRWAE